MDYDCITVRVQILAAGAGNLFQWFRDRLSFHLNQQVAILNRMRLYDNVFEVIDWDLEDDCLPIWIVHQTSKKFVNDALEHSI